MPYLVTSGNRRWRAPPRTARIVGIAEAALRASVSFVRIDRGRKRDNAAQCPRMPVFVVHSGVHDHRKRSAERKRQSLGISGSMSESWNLVGRVQHDGRSAECQSSWYILGCMITGNVLVSDINISLLQRTHTASFRTCINVQQFRRLELAGGRGCVFIRDGGGVGALTGYREAAPSGCAICKGCRRRRVRGSSSEQVDQSRLSGTN
jgi:hypothetical protein